MKRKGTKASTESVLHDAVAPYTVPAAMVRTQVYLTRAEHKFVLGEASRRNEPMASVIRAFIDEKMHVGDDAWANNPMLRPPVEDTAWEGREDGALNHDHYVHGAPKRWIKKEGKWIEAPPLPEDYFDNRTSADAYDRMVSQMDEAK